MREAGVGAPDFATVDPGPSPRLAGTPPTVAISRRDVPCNGPAARKARNGIGHVLNVHEVQLCLLWTQCGNPPARIRPAVHEPAVKILGPQALRRRRLSAASIRRTASATAAAESRGRSPRSAALAASPTARRSSVRSEFG